MSPALFVQIDNARTTNAIGPIQRRHLTAQPAAPSAIIALVSAKRMNREQFFRVVSELDEDRLRKALWNLYCAARRTCVSVSRSSLQATGAHTLGGN
jgi:hypothetical protein